jgi:hypothetical protein
MGRGLDVVNYKKVMDCLRRKSLTWSEIVRETKLPRRTVTRALDSLEYWGLAKKTKKGGAEYWVWSEHYRVYETKHDYDLAIRHSRNLMDGLAAVSNPELFPERVTNPKMKKLVFLRDMAEEHLRTGYPSISGEIEEYSVFMKKRKILAREVARVDLDLHFEDVLNEVRLFLLNKRLSRRRDVERLVHKLAPEKIDLINRVEAEKAERNLRIAGLLQRLELQVMNGEPLDGRCELCPNIRFGLEQQ